jgi:hypothetical protein
MIWLLLIVEMYHFIFEFEEVLDLPTIEIACLCETAAEPLYKTLIS